MKEEESVTDDSLLALIEDLSQFENQFDLGGKFNIFEAAGMIRQETRHSRFLANLLDPGEAHGLGDSFLRCFLTAAVEGHPKSPVTKLQVAIGDLGDAIVYCERDNFDITIELPRLGVIFVVENKVDSSERADQLEDYRIRATKLYSRYAFMGCFLTTDGMQGEDEAWGTLSYGDIARQLKQILIQKSIAPAVSTGIQSYIELIERHIVVSEERIQACRAIYAKHRTAIDLINQYGPVSGFSEALGGFFSQIPEINQLQTGSTHCAFADNRWLTLKGFQVADTKRWQATCPVKYWFRHRPGKLILRLEVGPVRADCSFNRTDFIQRLRKEVDGKDRQLIGDTFTRIRTHSTTIGEDPPAEELLAAMNQLWQTMGNAETSTGVLRAASASLR